MKLFNRYLAVILTVVMLITCVGASAAAATDTTGSGTSSGTSSAPVDTTKSLLTDDTAEEQYDPEDVDHYLNQKVNATVFSKYTYSEYIANYSDKTEGRDVISFGAADPAYLTQTSGTVNQISDFDTDTTFPTDGIAGQSLLTQEGSEATWQINVADEGLYVINLLYFNIAGKNNDIERTIYIDGTLPFTEAGGIVFPRTWRDSDEGITQDLDGNDIRASSDEVNAWYNGMCRDTSGKYGDYFKFYLSAGTHTIKLVANKENVVFNRVTVKAAPVDKTYEELKNDYASKGYTAGSSIIERAQAESMDKKSAATIYPEWDRTSCNTEPCSYDTICLNYIKGDKFSNAYQWVEWNFDVEQAGLYNITTRFKQSDRDGAYCNRTVYVNGEVPCAEARHCQFAYDDSWQVSNLCTPDGEDFQFYFHEGVNTVRLEVTLGDFADIVARMDNVIYSLNNCYRNIMMVTGSSPDTFRDYQFESLIPDVIQEMKDDLAELQSIVAEIKTLADDSGSFTSSFNTLMNDIQLMTDTPTTIAKRLENFKSNLGTISTWTVNITSQPVGFDWIQVTPVGSELPNPKSGFFEGLVYQTKMFASSFYMDYNNVGRTEASISGSRAVTVWVATSQDQSQIIRRLIDNSLAAQSDLKVTLKLVSGGTILPSITAGIGPDVVMGVGNSDPVNYAIRGAVMDVSQFNNFDTVMSRFNSSAYIPYQYKGKTYGVPETFSFSMLFYRKDVLSELGMGIPQTWSEVYDCIVKLNMNGLYFGASDVYGTLLYQNGGSYYNDDGTASALDTATSIRCFKEWTEFYTAYGCLVTYDFANRFRTGEMPLGIAGFGTYNQLSVFAPEIKGLWGFTDMPGTVQEDGTVDHTVLGGGSASIIIRNAKDPQAAFDFIDWWTSTSTQVAYGQEIESILGPSARYSTANLEAMSQLPWSTDDYNAIAHQWQSARALPEYPGSYILGRYLGFAFNAVVNQGDDPGESLLDNVKLINEELVRKQKEFANNEANQ